VVRRNKVLENFRSGGRAHATCDHHIFNGNRNSRQSRQRLARGGQRVDAPGLRQRALFAKRQKRANLGVFFSDSRVAILSQRGRARLPLRDLAPNLINRHGTKSSGIWLSTAISQSPSAPRTASRP